MEKEKKIDTYTKIFWVFIIGSIIGTYYEQILMFFKSGTWQSRASVLYGPFNIVYGAGLALFIIFLGKNNKKRKWYLTFSYSSIIGGITEYFTSLFLEKIYHMRFWNYEGEILNIGGRTTGVYILCWGLVGLIFMKWIYPLFEKKLLKINFKVLDTLTYILTIFMIFNLLISFTALYRYHLRRQNKVAKTYVCKLYDKYYYDNIIEKVYSNIEYI